MRKANELSRRLNWKVGVEEDNENQILIKKQWIHSLVEVGMEELEVEILVKVLWGDKWQIEREIEGRKDLCTKGQEIENRNNLVTSWYTSGKT